MSFFDDASWVLIPEGIKEDVVYAQKPTDGLGDLTFTRASDATRTNSAGVIERTPWNLVTWSEMFSDVAWTKNFTSVSANTSTAPNGTLTADTISGDGTANLHAIIHSLNAVNGVTYTHSVYAKRGTNNFIQLIGGVAVYTSGLVFANFDLLNGVLGSTGGGATATITNVGNGWYRCTMTATATATVTGSGLVLGLVSSATSARGELNSLTTNVLLWGAQLVEGTDAKPYFATTNRQDVPRLDYRNADGSVSTCPRLLLEPQRTNSIRNSTMVGAVAGSPGTLPTNWTFIAAGLTQTIVGTGIESGIQYIDIRYNGTATSSLTRIILEPSGVIAGTVGQTFSWSNYLKFIATPSAPNSTRLRITERNSGGGALTQGDFTISPTTTLQRFVYTRANTDATCAFVNPEVTFVLTNGATYDFTIRIAAPQMELGATASTFIPTTTAAVTRVPEIATRTDVSAIIGQTEGTLFLDFESGANDSIENIFGIINTGSTNRIYISRTTGNLIAAVIRTGGVNQAIISSSVITANTRYSCAVAYKENDFVLYINGTLIGTDNSGTVGACNTIGNNVINTLPFYRPINQAALFPTRLTNAQLAQLTTL